MYYENLPVILGLIGGFMCPDRRSQGFGVGCGGILQSIMQHQTRYAWGACMLTHLYHHLHHIVYDDSASLSTGCTLL